MHPWLAGAYIWPPALQKGCPSFLWNDGESISSFACPCSQDRKTYFPSRQQRSLQNQCLSTYFGSGACVACGVKNNTTQTNNRKSRRLETNVTFTDLIPVWHCSFQQHQSRFEWQDSLQPCPTYSLQPNFSLLEGKALCNASSSLGREKHSPFANA